MATLLKKMLENPGYVFVRGAGRFAMVRKFVTIIKGWLEYRRTVQYRRELEAKIRSSLFKGIQVEDYMRNLNASGCNFGLSLPQDLVEEIRNFAESNPVYAFRDPKLGFMLQDRSKAEVVLGREILLAQYFNAREECPAISRIAEDPLLNLIALNYLGSFPKFLGIHLWWTFPVTPNREDQMKHAHFFHRDIDDFKFLKFFFYLTDVEKGDGGHWVVAGSHQKAPNIHFRDRFMTRRYEDREIEEFYEKANIIEVAGVQGQGFAEDTLCVHKAATPVRHPRLILQLQFGLFDFVPEKEKRSASELKRIC
jgi:hypothetical protein